MYPNTAKTCPRCATGAGTGERRAVNVLTLNSGSSSLKFGVYRVDSSEPVPLVTGAIETGAGAQAGDQIAAVLTKVGDTAPDAIGHRIVHGGPSLRQPCRIDSAVLRTFEAAIPFAPQHLPAELALVRAAGERFPSVPQVACFDTGFHAAMPAIATTLPLPEDVRERGVQRYGFHGLSCASIVRQLGAGLPDRLVIAHLGNGASVTAVKAGRSIDTSMGLTPSGGVIMGTRAGDLDPGVLVYLMREMGLDADGIETLIDKRSGLLGISGVSNDVRQLHAAAATSPRAALALAMFARSVAKQIAAMIVSLGSIDALVFTGGIGENDPNARTAVIEGLSWTGIAIDEAANRLTGNPVNAIFSRAAILVLPAREDEEIARHTRHLMQGTKARS